MSKPGSSFTPTLLGHEDNFTHGINTEEEPSTPTTEESTTATEPVIYLTQAPPNLTYPSIISWVPGVVAMAKDSGRIVHCQTYPEIGQTVARLPDWSVCR
ncbi:hypothetical protein TNCV_4560701 [Trichonephila clavipes]|nr:hypothetical protein TNCV_4560701 [Trichonephila clavipes]